MDNTLFERLAAYGQSDHYPFHMPGHKRQKMNGLPKQLAALDITEIDGFDNLHRPEGILKELQEQAAAACGAEESFYLVNGSTAGVLTAMSAAVPEGGKLLIARNCHRSVYHGAYLRHLSLVYLYPRENRTFDLCEAVTPEQVEEALEREPGIDAVLIVSPTYEGRLADVAGIARVVHRYGLPLIVDEAHGAHLGFHPGFAQNSCRQGADVVIQSVHKTLPALTQTALLHCNGDLVDRELIRRFFGVYQSSSPSYVLMGSIDNAVRTARDGEKLFVSFLENWKRMLEALSACRHLRTLPGAAASRAEDVRGTYDREHDIGKLVISVKGTDMTGEALYQLLLEKYHLQMEMASETYVLAMFTIGDTGEGYERLTRALLEIDAGLTQTLQAPLRDIAEDWGRAQDRIPFCRAWDMRREYVPLEKAVGRFAGDFVSLYPPGTPILVPGECLEEAIEHRLRRCLDSGLNVQGLRVEEGKLLFPVIE